jgi:hypothetical protein
MKFNPMALKDVQWKQFFIEKGERVGLGITVILMVVILVMSLFLPDHGFLLPGPGDNAGQINKSSDFVATRQHSATPAEADKPPPIPAVPVSFEITKFDDPGEYRTTKLWLPPPAGSTKRRMPELFQPDEGTAKVAFSQIRSFVFSPLGDNPYGTIMILEGGSGAAQVSNAQQSGNAPSGRVLARYARGPAPGGFTAPTGGGGGGPLGIGGGGGGGGPLGIGGGGGGGGPLGIGGGGGGGGPLGIGGGGGGPIGIGAGGPGVGGFGGNIGSRQANAARAGQLNTGVGADDRGAMRTRFIEVDKITEANLPRFAEKVVPLRQVIVCAAFPYRKQVEEFQRKLRLPSSGAVLGEASEEHDADDTVLPAFRFLGVDVQRRTVSPEGKPLDSWQTLDLAAAIKPFIIANGTRFEDDPKEPPELSSLIVDGLWMPLLRQFTEENKYNKYPAVEMELRHIQKTLQDLKGKEVEQIVTSSNPILDKDDFNPFRPRAPRKRSAPPGPAGASGTARPRPAVEAAEAAGGGPGRRGYRGAAIPTPQGSVLPEYVLVRVVDVNIDPGKIYEYRLHVRMANPNYKRNAEVLSPSYAVEPELVPAKDRKDSDWFVVPTKVSVPPEFYYYAVDQKDMDAALGRPYGGIHARDTVYRDGTVFQIHRWLEDAAREGSNLPVWVGEWTVAERVLVSKGEFIGRTETVAVPVWSPPRADFVLAVPQAQAGSSRRRELGIEVDFKLPNDDAILVDFEGGNQEFKRKSRRDDRPETVKVDDRTGTEVLIVSSDGRVMARDNIEDALNADRVKRLDQWRDRVREVLFGGHKAVPGGTNPFAPTGPVGPNRNQRGGAG